MKNKIKIIVINTGFLIFLILFIEVIGQIGYLIKNGELYMFRKIDKRKYSQVFERHPYLVGRLKSSIKVTHNEVTITTTEHNTRWTGYQSNGTKPLKIAVFGGSTTFGTNVTDEDSWPYLLQERLGNKFQVINYGVPGYSTLENIIQLSFLTKENTPDIIIFYEGWNDMRSYHEKNTKNDYYNHGMGQFNNLRLFLPKKNDKYDILKNNFTLVALTDWIAGKIKKQPPKNSNKRHKSPDTEIDNYYLRNLKSLKLLSENFGATSIFIPQVMNINAFENEIKQSEWALYLENKAIPKLMFRFNNIMDSINVNNKTSFLFKNVVFENWNTEDFVDRVHFSRKGNIKFSNLVYDKIISIISSD